MRSYIIKRLLLVLPTMFVASLVAFFIIRLIPGTIIDLMVSEFEAYTQMDVEALEHALGLDVAAPIQYGRWMGFLPDADGSFNGIFQGNFGVSFMKGTPVFREIWTAVPVTLELVIIGLIVALLIALPIGIYSASRQDTWGDYIGRSFAILCIAVPGFWLATMIIVFPSIWWGYMPSIKVIPFTEDPIGNLKMFIIPATVLGMAIAGTTMRMTRTMMLEVLRQDYIRTAWAKGLGERVVVLRHALKNALIPVVTIVAIYIPFLIGSSAIIEEIFCLPGIGRLILNATNERDYMMVSGVLIFFAGVLLIINLITDIIYAYLDPRVHYK